MFNLTNRSKIYVKQFRSEEGKPNCALLSFNGKIKDLLVQRFKENYSIEGSHIKNGGQISPKSILTLIGSGGGALGVSTAMSGQLFMATANPTTLMAIGNGVGSAVMGGGAIVAHAPFIPIAGALMPVLAPLIAFQTISTIMIMNQFRGIHEKLDRIEKSINRLIQRSEANFIGEILSASKRIEEIEAQFGVCKQFTSEMIIRIALVEDKVNPIFERYQFLYQTQDIEKRTTIQDLKFKQNDAYFGIILSILDLRINLLRLKLSIQENAGYMKRSAERLIEKADYYKELWIEIGANPTLIEGVADELRETVADMNWWQKSMPGWLGGEEETPNSNRKPDHINRKTCRCAEERLSGRPSSGSEIRSESTRRSYCT